MDSSYKSETDSVQITAKGIKNSLSKYKEQQAVAELIWNGFDAKASIVKLYYSVGPLGLLEGFRILDNGEGIPYDALDEKFKPFLESEKNIETEDTRNTSVRHGKNGVGRLTFFKLADRARWNTIYKDKSKYYNYSIAIEEDTIDKYIPTKPTDTKKRQTGTEVTLDGIINISEEYLNETIIPYLKLEFAWFLELHKERKYKILINDNELNYSDKIGDQEELAIRHESTGNIFNVRYIRWTEGINKELSKYYYLDHKNEEQYKEYTRLNKKGDHFYHSVYIKSSYFDNFNWHTSPSAKMQGLDGIGIRSDACFEYLHEQLYTLLRKKRHPFIKSYANELVQTYEQENIIPSATNEWDALKIDHLKETVKGLYEVQPRLFATMNIEQKKTFVGLLNLVLDSDERENILDIIRQVVDLMPDEREQLAKLFEITTLSRITSTIRLLADRYRAVLNLRELVFNENLGANEVEHVQKYIEAHYWIFGEEYSLVTAAEPDFEEALRRYLHILGRPKANVKVSHPDKNKEMDIFLCRQCYSKDVENIVVELKHPHKSLGKDELDQTERYMRTILNIPEFNDRSSTWTFILVGNKLSRAQHESKPYIQSKIEQCQSEGKPYLAAFERDMKYYVYVKTWSQIFTEFEQRHNFLTKKLEIQRSRLTKNKTANEILLDSKSNYAAQASA